MSKLLLRGGTVVDGTGQAPYRADVAILGDVICEVGPDLDVMGCEVVEVDGLVVSPGFIDLHTHSDRTIFANPLGDSKVMQGVTTEVVGNCGVGSFPVSPERIAELASYLNTLEGSLPPDGITWTDLNGFARMVESYQPGINLAPLVPHGALRIAAMGHEDRPAVPSEMQKMKDLLTLALDQGAWGMSTGLIYPPGSFAPTEELIELAHILARFETVYTSHVRGESTKLPEAVDEAIRIGQESGARVVVSHLKAIGAPNWGKAVAAMHRIDSLRTAGLDIWADQYPYEATSTTLSALVPGWAHDGGVKALLARLCDPDLKERLTEAVRIEMNVRGGAEKVVIAAAKTPDQSVVGKNMQEIAAQRGLEPATAAIELLVESQGGVSAVYFSLGKTDLETILQNPHVAVGSDGQATNPERDAVKHVHPRSYGTFPRVLGEYVREKKLLPLETAIRKMSGLPAQILRMNDRGLLKAEYKADITVFDPATIKDLANFANPHRYAQGVAYVLINGTLAVQEGKITGSGKGSVLRKRYR